MKTYRTYYILSLGFIVVGLLIQLIAAKGETTLYLNGLHNPSLDLLFKYATSLGEWLGLFFVFFVLLFTARFKHVLAFLLAVGLAAGTSQLLKHQVFPEHDRPASQYAQLHEVVGENHHKKNSFPSGHTTSAFSIFTMFALVMRKRSWQIVSALAAFSAGVSRMYLGQHYLMDVVAGACLGMCFATFFYYWSERWNAKFLQKQLLSK